MRLSKKTQKTILDTAQKIFGTEVEVYVFGSRTDFNKRGGDIDIFVNTRCPAVKNKLDKKINFIVQLKKELGEQKIDVVINSNKDKKIEKVALTKGIKL